MRRSTICNEVFNKGTLYVLSLCVLAEIDRGTTAKGKYDGGVCVITNRCRDRSIGTALMHHLDTIACRGMDEQCCLSRFCFCRLALQDIHIGIEIIDVIEIVLGRFF